MSHQKDTHQTPDHTLLTELPHLTDWHARSTADRAAHTARLVRLRDTVPTDVDSVFGTGLGAMYWDEKKGKPGQKTDKLQLMEWSLRDIYNFIGRESRVCNKYDSPGIYCACPAAPADCHKTNFHHSRLIAIDLDGTIKDPAGLRRLRRWCGMYGCILYSTARHDPAHGIYRLRILLLVTMAMTYEEHVRVAAAICAQLAAHLGTSDGIDGCSERAFQAMLIPGWASQELADQAIVELYEGDTMDTTLALAAACADIAAEQAKAAAKSGIAGMVRRPRATVSSTGVAAVVAGVDGIDRLARAQLDLDALGSIHKGCGRSNKDLFIAACILRDWGLDEAEAVDEMTSRYSDQDADWIRVKVRSAYDSGSADPRTGWRLRAALRDLAGPVRLEDLYDLKGQAGDGAVELVASLGAESAEGGSAGDAQHALNPAFTGTLPLEVTTLLKLETPSGAGSAHEGLEDSPPPPPPHTAGPVRRLRQIHTPSLPDLADFANLTARVTAIKSPTGTRKNVHMKPAMQAAQARDERVVTGAHRRALTRSQSAVWGLPCYLDSRKGRIDGSISICLDSVARLGDGPIDVLVLDECEQFFRHLYSRTIRKRGTLGVVYSALRDALRRARKIVLLDADLGPLSIYAVRLMLGEDVSEEIVINDWQPSGVIRVRSEAGWWQDLVVTVRDGIPCWVYCTSRKAAERHAKMLRELYPTRQILLVHSGTSGRPEAQACMADPDKFGAYDIVICTPSVGTGVSVEHQSRWHVFGDIVSGAGPLATDAKQGLCRPRDPQKITITVHGRRRHESTNATVILADLLTRSKRTKDRLAGQTWQAKYRHDLPVAPPEGGVLDLADDLAVAPVDWIDCDEDITSLQSEVLAAIATIGNHLHDITDAKTGAVVARGALLLHLEEVGYTLVHVPDDADVDVKSHKEQVKDVKAKVAKDWVDLVDSTPDGNEGEILALEDAGASTPEAEAMLARHHIRRFYGIPQDLEIPIDLIERDERGEHRGECVQAAQVLAAQRGEVQALDRLDRLDASAGVSAQLEHHGRAVHLEAGLWRLLGIRDLVHDSEAGTVLRDPGDIWASEDSRVQELRKEVKQYLKITLKPGQSSSYWARTLASRAGLRLVPVGRAEDGRRLYVLDRDSVRETLSDAAAYYERITEPGKSPHDEQSAGRMSSPQDEVARICAGILDDAA